MTNLNHALEIIFSGFVVRTREEMKPFETLVNKRISFDRDALDLYLGVLQQRREKIKNWHSDYREDLLESLRIDISTIPALRKKLRSFLYESAKKEV